MQPFLTHRVHIPVSTPAPPRGADQATRVLLVSSDADTRHLLARVLQHAGYIVEAAAHSGHALLLCRVASFDLLLAELSSPDMSGPALAERVRRHCPGMAAVYVANPGTPEGVEHVLVRPFTQEDLLAELTAASAEERAVAR